MKHKKIIFYICSIVLSLWFAFLTYKLNIEEGTKMYNSIMIATIIAIYVESLFIGLIEINN